MATKTTPASPTEARPKSKAFAVAGAFVRAIIILPVVATMAAALALMVWGTIDTWNFIQHLLVPGEHPLSRDAALLHAIEIVDLFLLATVVQVVSLGLYQLYFRQDLELPNWLRINDLDDLKSKLVGVSITVLAVFFLGKAITWSGGIDILYLGGAGALVIVALTYFLSKIDKH
ncbi:MAG: YqhA family protein [Hyphomicrobiales bacterium]|nr:MAG: YqhA family protein [Hyphomicrobiales bacterium]